MGKSSQIRDGYLFVLPAILIMGIFTVYPSIRLFWLSMNSYRIMEGNLAAEFIGFANYKEVFQDSLFYKTLWNSFYFPLVVTPLQTALALWIAILLSNRIRFVAFFRTVYFIPVVMSFVVVGMFWKEMLNTNSGFINEMLGLVHLPQHPFLTNPAYAKFSIAMVSIWKSWGWYMVIFIAALSQVPKDIYESAVIDGANAWQKFWRITLPLIRRTMLFVIIVSTMNCIKLFAPIMVMTNGGPTNSTKSIVHHMWLTAFRMSNYGYAAAMAVVLFFIILAISVIQYSLLRQED